MISPKEYDILKKSKSGVSNTLVISMIDDYIKKQASVGGIFPWVQVSLEVELSKENRELIAEEYLKVGWFTVCSYVSSECGEKPGFTHFVFCTKESFEDWKDCYHNDLDKWKVKF